MKKYNIITLIVVALVTLTGCNKKDNSYLEDTKYLSVRLQGSDKWSILDIETGKHLLEFVRIIQRICNEQDPFPHQDTTGYLNPPRNSSFGHTAADYSQQV